MSDNLNTNSTTNGSVQGEGMATAGLILGIVGLLCGGTVSILAIIFSAISMNKLPPNHPSKTKAIVGLVLGIIGIIWGMIAVILYLTILYEVIANFGLNALLLV